MLDCLRKCRFSRAPSLWLVAMAALPALGSCDSTRVIPVVRSLLATACVGQNTLSWEPLPGANSYNVYFASEEFADLGEADQVSVPEPPYFHAPLSNETTYYYRVSAVNEVGEGPASDLVSATPSMTPMNTPDPFFEFQWHLRNTGQGGGTIGEDLNVLTTWDACLRGEGVRVTIVDEELEIRHEDLDQNTPETGHIDFAEGDDDPTGTPNREHGTAVAGIVGARDGNGLGVHGVAPRSTLVGYNLLARYTSANLLDAFTRDVSNQAISNNSWGNITRAGDLRPALATFEMAMAEGLSNGRGGKGIIYLMAAGNDAECANDQLEACEVDANTDGYHNHRGMMVVAAVEATGERAAYSERGANLWISGPAGPGGDGLNITTTDRTGDAGYNPGDRDDEYSNQNYSKDFAGTSAATPALSGVVALMLQANPDLGWRDVRHILARTARKIDPTDPGWATNGSGFNINHGYGFGYPDTEKAIDCATGWTNVGAELSDGPHESEPASAIPDNDMTGVSDTISVSGSGIGAIEYINVTLNAEDHPASGDLEIVLTNDATGTQSVLMPEHECSNGCDPYADWTFASVFHLGEAADADWTLRIRDLDSDDAVMDDFGTFNSWSITFYGTAAAVGSCP